eukprot:TRINITY_DN7512_c1_g1_i2.p1 TRINITY_DN7512_c1_g1~~TRINITY_DN7512_c1_g1_i2.p1  ORF type:complete len:622 (+),score=167.17 TRINITY_DN7512_c1_g1_i2:65-1930(+)
MAQPVERVFSFSDYEKKRRAEQEQEKRWEVWAAIPQELQEWRVLFNQIDTGRTGFITASQIKDLFLSSGIEKDTLGRIWSLSDRDRDQKLDINEYCLAKYLMAAKMRGETLPADVPSQLLQSIFQTPSPRSTPSMVSPPSSPIPNYGPNFHPSSAPTSPSALYGVAPGSPLLSSPPPSLPRPKSVQLPPSSPVHSSPSSSSSSPYDSVNDFAKRMGFTAPSEKPHRADSYGHIPSPDRSSSFSAPSDLPLPSPALIQSLSKDDLHRPSEQWYQHQTPEGQTYYHDKTSNRTTWTKPEGQNINSPRPSSLQIEPPKLGKETANSILENPEKIEFFKKFLGEENTNLEILFVMDIREFKNSAIKDPTGSHFQVDLKKAMKIYKDYFATKPINPIRLSKPARKKIRRIFKDLENSPLTMPRYFPEDLFDEALNEVTQIIETEQLPRFLKSLVYIAMYNCLAFRQPYELPEELWNKFLQAADGDERSGWEFGGETKGILIHKKKFSGSDLYCIKGSGMVPIPPNELKTFVVNLDFRAQWDHLYDGGKKIEILDKSSGSEIVQHSYRPPGWAKPFFKHHDFVVLKTEKTLSDGTIMVLSRSVVHKDAPERTGYNRDEADVSGFVIR